jgi:flagellar basal-body rod modification protein FlgD
MASISTDPTTSSLQQILSSTSSPGAKSTTTDFNMFLKLLTTQMQNQDPLSPMDSTQYTQQLVQYSQVEQSVQQNSTLKDILGSLSNQTIGQAAHFIGRDAVFDSAVSGLGAKPASWQYAADRTMASGTVTIRDAGGKTVFTAPLDVSKTSGAYAWDGTLANGGKAAAGAYTLALSAVDASGASVATRITSTGVVDAVNASGGVVSLGVNGVPMPMTALVRLAATGA